MKSIFLTVLSVVFLLGCANQGGMSNTSHRDTGYRADDHYGPMLPPSTMERDFPGRMGPGGDRPLDPAIPR